MSKQKPWPADRVERRSVKSMMAYPRNARVHSDEQVDQIAASMREFGWTIPVLVDEAGVLIAGHGRVMAANKLGIEDIPVMVASGWSEDQKRAYRIADNALPEKATWDAALLRLELTDLKLADYDLKLTGFDDLQLVQFMAGGPNGADPEDAPEPPVMPVSKRGDVWVLGNHRILCGDATSSEDVGRLLDGAKPHLMVTDPPYGVEYDPAHRRAIQLVDSTPAQGKVVNDDQMNWHEAWNLFGGDVAYVWHASMYGGVVADGLGQSGLVLRSQIIWAKQHFIVGRGDYHWRHESCWYAVRKGKTGHWNGDRTQSTLWDIKAQIGWVSSRPDNHDKATGHSTQKPIECMKRPIENNSKPGDAVYDPFVGSFTTGIACEMTGRRCYAMEISEQYVDTGIIRWQNLTGKNAILEGTKLTYEQVRKQRASARPKSRKSARADVQPA